MSRLLTHRIATMTEMREPHKVLETAGKNPVAIMRNSKCVGYFVPAEVVDDIEISFVDPSLLNTLISETKEVDREVLDYLKDK